MKYIVLVVFSFVGWMSANAQHPDEVAIRKVLAEQEKAWNTGDIDSFMQGYWNSDSLMFIGAKGITYGFKNTLTRYKNSYNSPEKMGRLKFDLLHFLPLADDTWMVVGKWQLTRTAGDVGGHYTLVFRRFGNRWLIVSDHTS